MAFIGSSTQVGIPVNSLDSLTPLISFKAAPKPQQVNKDFVATPGQARDLTAWYYRINETKQNLDAALENNSITPEEYSYLDNEITNQEFNLTSMIPQAKETLENINKAVREEKYPGNVAFGEGLVVLFDGDGNPMSVSDANNNLLVYGPLTYDGKTYNALTPRKSLYVTINDVYSNVSKFTDTAGMTVLATGDENFVNINGKRISMSSAPLFNKNGGFAGYKTKTVESLETDEAKRLALAQLYNYRGDPSAVARYITTGLYDQSRALRNEGMINISFTNGGYVKTYINKDFTMQMQEYLFPDGTKVHAKYILGKDKKWVPFYNGKDAQGNNIFTPSDTELSDYGLSLYRETLDVENYIVSDGHRNPELKISFVDYVLLDNKNALYPDIKREIENLYSLPGASDDDNEEEFKKVKNFLIKSLGFDLSTKEGKAEFDAFRYIYNKNEKDLTPEEITKLKTHLNIFGETIDNGYKAAQDNIVDFSGRAENQAITLNQTTLNYSSDISKTIPTRPSGENTDGNEEGTAFLQKWHVLIENAGEGNNVFFSQSTGNGSYTTLESATRYANLGATAKSYWDSISEFGYDNFKERIRYLEKLYNGSSEDDSKNPVAKFNVGNNVFYADKYIGVDTPTLANFSARGVFAELTFNGQTVKLMNPSDQRFLNGCQILSLTNTFEITLANNNGEWGAFDDKGVWYKSKPKIDAPEEAFANGYAMAYALVPEESLRQMRMTVNANSIRDLDPEIFNSPTTLKSVKANISDVMSIREVISKSGSVYSKDLPLLKGDPFMDFLSLVFGDEVVSKNGSGFSRDPNYIVKDQEKVLKYLDRLISESLIAIGFEEEKGEMFFTGTIDQIFGKSLKDIIPTAEKYKAGGRRDAGNTGLPTVSVEIKGETYYALNFGVELDRTSYVQSKNLDTFTGQSIFAKLFKLGDSSGGTKGTKDNEIVIVK